MTTTTPHDIRIALRFLRRNPTFAIAAVGILALGISLTTVLLTIVRGTLIEPWPYRGYDRIVTMSGNYPTQGRTDFSLWSVPEIEDLRAAPGLFEHVIAGDPRNLNLTYAGRPERVRAAAVTPNAFTMLGVPAALGRTLDDRDAQPGAPPAVLVTYQFWQTRLGADRGVVGRTLHIGDVPYTIVGVMPKPFVFWNRELWLPLTLEHGSNRSDRRYFVQAQLRGGVSLERAATRLRVLSAQWAATHPEAPEYEGSSVAIRLLVENVLRDLRPTLYILLGAVTLVLVVAAANLANASLAKAMSRDGELAIRRAIGGSLGQIARQLLVENAIVGAAGGLCGVAGAAFLLPQVLSLIPYGYVPAEAHVELDWRIAALSTTLAAGFGLVVGLVPALRAAAIQPAVLLRQGDTRTGSRRSHQWRDAFVTAQLALAVVVLGVATASAASLWSAVRRDPGYTADAIWTARVALPASTAPAPRQWEAYQRIVAELRRNPAISEVAVASLFPVGELPTTLVSAAGRSGAHDGATVDAATIVSDASFFRLLRIPLVEGRVFADADDPSHPTVAIVTRELSQRLWPGASALGQSLALGGGGARTAVVVGVAGDVTTDLSAMRVRPALFLAAAQQPLPAATIGLATKDLRRALPMLEQAVRTVDAEIPVYSPQMLEQAQIDVLGPRLLSVTLLAVFGLSTLALSAVGIYAVVSQSVQERAQELRIRLTFGAEPAALFRGELARAGRLVVISAAAGVAIALAALRILRASFEGFGSTATLPLAGSTALLVCLALLATAIPAWPAAHGFNGRGRSWSPR